MRTRPIPPPTGLRGFVREVIRRFHPVKIILFGSHARGTARAGSDVDLLVLMNFRGLPSRQALAIRRDIPRTFPMDLILRTPAQAARALRTGDMLLRQALGSGKVLYESRRPRMGG